MDAEKIRRNREVIYLWLFGVRSVAVTSIVMGARSYLSSQYQNRDETFLYK